MAASNLPTTVTETTMAPTAVKKQVLDIMLRFNTAEKTLTSVVKVEQGLAEGPWSFSDHGKKCETKLKSNPYDLESWNVLVREAQVWF